MNIWELAEKKVQENRNKRSTTMSENESYIFQKEKKESIESYIIVAGSPKTGKTTYLNRFLEKNESLNSTIILEYSFGYRIRDTSKDIIHIWELSSDVNLSPLVQVPFIEEHLNKNIGFFIVIDLTKPETIWSMIEEFINSGRKKIDNVIDKGSSNFKNNLLQTSWERIGEKDVGSNSIINPFPIPLYIIGAKYDIFQNEDTEKRKNVSLCLRILNFLYGGCLIYSSINMENLLSRTKTMLSHAAFKINYPKGIITDINKPLFVPFGSDSLESIGSPSGKIISSNSSFKEIFDEWKRFYNKMYPQKMSNITKCDEILEDEKFAEPVIDILFEEKQNNLQRYIKENEEREATLDRAHKNEFIF
uniref:Cytoplasmic dynein 2 light intermediate chain 1 n=1 Tax=Parastrongyloides trichosuri TaxID=131310 RepID=A0A0N4ZE61_PARTI